MKPEDIHNGREQTGSSGFFVVVVLVSIMLVAMLVGALVFHGAAPPKPAEGQAAVTKTPATPEQPGSAKTVDQRQSG